MCLAVPFKITKKIDNMAVAELKGFSREVSVALTPEVEVGDWVLVHAGFAIHSVTEDDARETLKLLEELHEAESK